MNNAKRPWWLLLNKSHQLMVTLTEDNRPGERVFTITGQPLVQGLTWLTCGPISALIAIAVLVGLAISLEIREQGLLAQILFIGGFLALPALVWGITVIAANRLSARHVQAIRDAETQTCVIRLNQKGGILAYQQTGALTETEIPYGGIQQARVAPSIGARDSKSMNLILETVDGPVTLLNKHLGTPAQKIDLAQEIETALRNFEANKNPRL